MTGFPILLYHRVGPLDGTFMDEYTVSPARFAEQLKSIAGAGWRVVSLADALRQGRAERKRTVVITFDDGFDDNRKHAWPALKRHGFPSDTFIVSGHIGSTNGWDGTSRANYDLLSMDALLEADPSLHTFHAHSVTHADLTFLDHDAAQLRRELEESRRIVAGLPNGGNFFAYPRGSWSWKVMNDVKGAGFSGAVTSMGGLNSSRTNPFLLRRTEIREEDVGHRFALKLRTGRNLTRWPPTRPPEVSIFGRWLRGRSL